ncbi:hypothetical protein FHE65_34455 [Mumia zhuanghuii]|uniref:Uncharacterized protein n=1 Tax=Mumia zhuanghuii TaxID=2585211 RepID=A0A5C4M325_9ACTN|nr:hypothetical protein FHE65_34455 [Mumia zhuanghuii]
MGLYDEELLGWWPELGVRAVHQTLVEMADFVYPHCEQEWCVMYLLRLVDTLAEQHYLLPA